jgi:AcrR family transcriptional regulator
MTATATTVDGRRLRREQNRDAVLDALVQLFDEGDYQPTADEVAARAGISPRSLFRYFEDVDDLARAAIERELQANAAKLRLEVDPGAPLDERITAVVNRRLELWEAVAPTARAARACAHRNHTVAGQLRVRRQLFRDQVAAAFAPELAKDPAALAVADVLCSFESVELLRRDQRLGRHRAAAALTNALTALLARS